MRTHVIATTDVIATATTYRHPARVGLHRGARVPFDPVVQRRVRDLQVGIRCYEVGDFSAQGACCPADAKLRVFNACHHACMSPCMHVCLELRGLDLLLLERIDAKRHISMREASSFIAITYIASTCVAGRYIASTCVAGRYIASMCAVRAQAARYLSAECAQRGRAYR
jgi:hypothetical protein